MYKQIIVVRDDLKLSRGKLCAQVAHASIEAYKISKIPTAKKWLAEGQKKVVLRVKSLEELKNLKIKCDSLKIPNALISDAGITEIRKGTITVLGIGPDAEKKINKVTGYLPLLK